ncbi:MAG: hypothetical protein LBI94_09910 [Treponema sp.]|nr:hypothetical protein [Treponema sp.]
MCWYCAAPVSAPEPIGRSLRCESCGRDIRSCRNCRFYSPGSSGDCREPQAAADPPRDRERANFCEWFSLDPGLRSFGAGSGPGQKSADMQKSEKDREDARRAFDNLFTTNG